jgi:GT2 family glycosyltransferase
MDLPARSCEVHESGRSLLTSRCVSHGRIKPRLALDPKLQRRDLMERIWKPIVEPLLGYLRPSVVVGIGVEEGADTEAIDEFCRRIRADLFMVEPVSGDDVEGTRASTDPLVFQHASDLQFVGKNPDVVLIDGGESWHAANRELSALAVRAAEKLGSFPLVLVYDTGGPGSTDRGDAALSRLSVSNSRMNALAAVEQFRVDSTLPLELTTISGVSGLGILYPTSLKESAPETAEFIEMLSSPMVTRALFELGDEMRAELQKVDDLRTRYERLRTRHSVRVALEAARVAKPVIGLVRRLSGREVGSAASKSDGMKVAGTRSRPPTLRAQRRLAKRITRERPGSPRVSGPLVSMIVLTRNGAEHLRRLLPSLDRTTYKSFEVVVVDNGSTDETRDLLRVPRSYPVQVIQNEGNVSFSEGNNQGATLASGEYLLLLNNDIEPINPGWLGAMVDALESGEDVAACGALLIHPVRGDPETDLTVQHFGTRFTFSRRGVRAVNMTATDPLDPSLGGVEAAPVATAATLLIRRDAFEDVGGLDPGYVYGVEDVDLCLSLNDRGGRIVVTGQAVLFHHESATQDHTPSEIKRMQTSSNRQRFMETWGPRLTRSVQRERLNGGGWWTDGRKRTVAITLTQNDISKGWGDFYTAHELGDAFIDLGWEVVYAQRHRDHWYELDGNVDLLVSLLDTYDVTKAPPGAVTVAWVRNWVDRWLERPWFEGYDLVACSSYKGARLLGGRSRFDPAVIPMATNLSRFSPGPASPTFACDYAFTGNNWGHGRDLMSLLDIRPDERFLLFGKGWDEDPRATRHWRGHLDYESLPDLYRSTKVLLDDTAGPTLPYAFLNSRVFDGLAAGALVITDNVEGAREMFDGLLPTFESREELRRQLDRYLGDESERRRLVERLQERVKKSHSYSKRPQEFLRLAIQHVEQPKAAVKVGSSDEESEPQWSDPQFADVLASALTRRGMPTEVHILPEWDLPQNQAVDVVIHIRGLTSYTPKPAHMNVLWIISHPAEVSARECEMYDVVLVASCQHAEELRAQIDTPVLVMPQQRDARHSPSAEGDPETADRLLELLGPHLANRLKDMEKEHFDLLASVRTP